MAVTSVTFRDPISGKYWQLTIDENGLPVTTLVDGPATDESLASTGRTFCGTDLIKLTQNKLGGFANAASVQVILGHLNEGKDEVWAILKSLDDQYFITATQSTDVTLKGYFPLLQPSVREYTLPTDFREIKFIEVVSPSEYADTRFLYRKLTHPDFYERRRGANVTGANSFVDTHIYTLAGSAPQRFMLADYVNTPIELRIWYVKSLPDFTATDNVDDIFSPYDRKIADYAAKRVMLANDLAKFEAWRTEWREDVLNMSQSAGPRNQADPQFVQDFEG